MMAYCTSEIETGDSIWTRIGKILANIKVDFGR
jgi:hypothetical protein